MTRKGLRVQEQILDSIGREGNPLSTSQLAERLKVSWHTVEHYCFELVFKGKIDQFVVGSSHIWMKKGSFSGNETSNTLQAPLQKQRYDEQKNQLKEQLLNQIVEKQFAVKIDKAIEHLLDKEINQTFKELQRSQLKQKNLKNTQQKLQQEEKVGEKFHERKE